MSRGIVEFLVHGQRFRKEFRKQLKNLIVFGAGFTIAFTWRQTIFDISESVVKFITHIQSSSTLSVLSSVLTTLVSLLIVLIALYALKNPPEEY